MKTQQNLAEEVVLELGRADAANPAESAEDIGFVKNRYAALLLELEDVAFWEANAIPERVFIPLAKLVAFECRQAFGRQDYDPTDSVGRTPMQRLQALASEASIGFPTETEYF